MEALSLGLAGALSLAGCDAILSSEAGLADRVEVSVTGSAAVPLLLITSTDFLAEYDFVAEEWRVLLVKADTTRLASLPYNQSRDIKGRDRYLVRLVNPDLSVTVDVGMDVRLDGRLVFTERAFLRDATLQYFTWFGPDGGP
jgi:hypothetical protein